MPTIQTHWPTNQAVKSHPYQWWIIGSIVFSLSLVTNDRVFGQIVPDGTVPTKVRQSGKVTVVTDGARAGNNLFHSFKEFSLATDDEVYFNNALQIKNIITRVTGGKISNIDGIIKANGAANLFLINPSGIIFGPNASLNIGGSLIATTADSIKFADGTEFSATNTQTSTLLTVSVPIGLQFGKQPGAITNQSKASPKGAINENFEPVGLTVKPEQTIALIGGEIKLAGGNITATQGRIELGSVGSDSTVTLTPVPQGWSFAYEGVRDFQDIEIYNQSSVDASQKNGTIAMQARTVKILQTSQITSITTDNNSAKGIFINTSESVQIIGDTAVIDPKTGQVTYFPSGLFTQVDSEATAQGGTIEINTLSLLVQNAGNIDGSTLGMGKGGDIKINASESVNVIGVGGNRPSTISTSTTLPQNTDSTEKFEGDGGNLTINTKKLSLRNGGVIDVSTFGKGAGGKLTINASESVEITGTGVTTTGLPFASTLFASSGAEDIDDPDLRFATGNGGNLDIFTKKLTITNQGQISASSLYKGNAGTIAVTANQVILDNQGKLRTETQSADGGNIQVEVADYLLLDRRSEISTSAGGKGNGGNIDIKTDNLVLADSSKIIAQADQGDGGKIDITTQGLFKTPQAQISATSRLGIDGSVLIQQPNLDPKTELVELPQELLDAQNLIAFTCAGNGNIAKGEFTITGRGGLPPSASEMLSTSAVLPDFGTITTTQAEQPPSTPNISTSANSDPEIVEAQGWVVNQQGSVVLVSESPNPAPSDVLGNWANCSKVQP